jgi:3'-phosphoadenosine 5'-phosphosulfate sulfotransferase (PAPS reductase)/FAD synthetase
LVVAFSGGKDSTALALRLHELGEDFVMLFTPTGDELPDLPAHIARVAAATGKQVIIPKGPSLEQLILTMHALPNWRMRWCTRMIKIEPCIVYLRTNLGSVLAVGLRADEPAREGLYGEFATYRYPLREWGWGLREVMQYVAARGFTPPPRTDCAVCPYQRIADWYWLWRKWPAFWQRAKYWEGLTGHTFRSAQRDTWPAALVDLEREFARGRVIRGYDTESDVAPCRVCRL